MTHAMVLTGDLDKMASQPSGRLKTHGENKVGTEMVTVASDAWMDEYTYQIVVRKELLTTEEQAAYEAEPIVLSHLGMIQWVPWQNKS